MKIYIYETGYSKKQSKWFRDRFLFESAVDSVDVLFDFIDKCREDKQDEYTNKTYQITTTFKEEY